jgi:hypothetical protein
LPDALFQREVSRVCDRPKHSEMRKGSKKGLDIHAEMEYYHFDVNVKVVQAL